MQFVMNTSTSLKGNASNTANSSSTTPVPEYLAIAVITFVAINILAGAFGNARVCILLRKRQDRKVAHYFVASLAAIGVFSSLFNMPMLLVMTVVNYFQLQDHSVPEILCKLGFPSGHACMLVNAMTLWLMAIDRHDCVLRPFSRRLTKTNVKKFMAAIWILALITFLFFAISIRNEPYVCVRFFTYNRKITRHPYGIIFTVVFTIIYQLDKITFVIVVVTFFRIMRSFRSSAVNPLNSLQQRREKKLTWLTFQLCGIFVLFRVPATVSNAIRGRETAVKTARLVTVALVHFTYVANPILYRKILNARPPNPLQAVTRQAGAHELVQTSAGARHNPNFTLES